MTARDILINVLARLKLLDIERLARRASVLEIGLSGNVSVRDHHTAEDERLEPLTHFERWLLTPHITSERKRRQVAFRQAVIDVTGEDPEEWL